MYGIGLLKGMLVTLRHLGRKPFTRQYPEEAVPIPHRFRGYDFAWVEERCTGCATCAKACPHGCINIVTHPLSDGRYSIDVFDIDIGLCMVCGLCVEACPYDALFMGAQFALSDYSRRSLVAHKGDIAQRGKLSAYYRPPLQGQIATRDNINGFYAPSPGVKEENTGSKG